MVSVEGSSSSDQPSAAEQQHSLGRPRKLYAASPATSCTAQSMSAQPLSAALRACLSVLQPGSLLLPQDADLPPRLSWTVASGGCHVHSPRPSAAAQVPVHMSMGQGVHEQVTCKQQATGKQAARREQHAAARYRRTTQDVLRTGVPTCTGQRHAGVRASAPLKQLQAPATA